MKTLVWACLLTGLQLTAAAGVWPQPQHQTHSQRVLYMQPHDFHFEVTGRGSDLLETALLRYDASLRDTPPYSPDATGLLKRLDCLAGRVHNLSVYVKYSDQSLNLETDESYTLHVEAPETRLVAATVFGALRGLETFSQLVDRVDLPPDVALGNVAAAAITESQPASQDWASAGRLRLVGSMADTLLGKHHHGKHGHGKHHGRHKHNKHHGKHHKQKHNHHHHHHHHHHKQRHRERSLWIINATTIKDAPRFQHRGLLIDTGRHFLPLSIIKAHLNAMAWSKLNVLHWHLVDDQSFPYESKALPQLSREGAFGIRAVYTPEDVAEVVAYARARGIRVVPELDTPGHSLSWGGGEPAILTQCYDDKGRPTGTPGPLDPTRNHTFAVVWKLLRELAAHFPDSYMHLGGDEVPLGCWEHNPRIRGWMKDHNISDVRALEQYYIGRVLQLAASADRSYMVWQEVLDNGVHVANDTLVQVWKWWWPTTADSSSSSSSSSGSSSGGGGGSGSSSSSSTARHSSGGGSGSGQHTTVSSASNSGDGADSQRGRLQCSLSTGCRVDGVSLALHDKPQGFVPELQRVTKKGFRTLLSSPWYLNLGAYGEENWQRYHAVEPLAFDGSDAQKALVVGGEAAMWGEFADASNALAKTWPDAAAVAERLWSPPADGQAAQEMHAARQRLIEHRCRMLARGGVASPLGPGFCPTDAAGADAGIASGDSASDM